MQEIVIAEMKTYLAKYTKNSYFSLLIIIFFAAILRLIYLAILPNGISGDEVDYMLGAKAFFLTGKDMSGTISAISVLFFNYPPTDAPKAELPYLFLMPVVGPLSFSLFTSRVLYAVCSILTVLLLFLIAKKLFNYHIALITAFIAAINPWFIFIGRTAYESGFAALFYLAGFYILLIAQKWNILWSLPVFILGFYSYIGTKILFLPFIFLSAGYVYFIVNNKKFFKQYLILFILALLFIFFFLFLLKQHPTTSRISEIDTPFSPDITAQVNAIRTASIANPLMNMYENKFVVYLKILISRFFAIFSANSLFVFGDNFFSIWRHGLFYYLDGVFLLLGFLALFVKKKIILVFLLLVILLSTVPQVFHSGTENFAPHITLLFPFFIIIIAFGIWYAINLVKNTHFKTICIAIIIGSYLLLLLNFINIYFFEFPLREYFDFPTRILSQYITLAKPTNFSIVVNTPLPQDVFKKYLYYTNSYNKATANAIKQAFKTKNYHLNNVTFISCSDKLFQGEITIVDNKCKNRPENTKHLTIAQLSDSGEMYQIFSDTICSKFKVKRYPSNIKLSDFHIEKFSKEKFCTTYITRFF